MNSEIVLAKDVAEEPEASLSSSFALVGHLLEERVALGLSRRLLLRALCCPRKERGRGVTGGVRVQRGGGGG